MHAFLSNLANRQTDRNEHRQTHVPPPLSEVNNQSVRVAVLYGTNGHLKI